MENSDRLAELKGRAADRHKSRYRRKPLASLEQAIQQGRTFGFSREQVVAVQDLGTEVVCNRRRQAIVSGFQQYHCSIFFNNLIWGLLITLGVNRIWGWPVSRWVLLIVAVWSAIRLIRWFVVPVTSKEMAAMEDPDRIRDSLAGIDLISICPTFSQYSDRLLRDLGLLRTPPQVKSKVADQYRSLILPVLAGTLADILDDRAIDRIRAIWLTRGTRKLHLQAVESYVSGLPKVPRELRLSLMVTYDRLVDEFYINYSDLVERHGSPVERKASPRLDAASDPDGKLAHLLSQVEEEAQSLTSGMGLWDADNDYKKRTEDELSEIGLQAAIVYLVELLETIDLRAVRAVDRMIDEGRTPMEVVAQLLAVLPTGGTVEVDALATARDRTAVASKRFARELHRASQSPELKHLFQ